MYSVKELDINQSYINGKRIRVGGVRINNRGMEHLIKKYWFRNLLEVICKLRPEKLVEISKLKGKYRGRGWSENNRHKVPEAKGNIEY